MKLQRSDTGQFKRWAFFSLTDKRGAVEYAKALLAADFGLMSAGGTCKMLDEAGLPVLDLAELVGGGAILGHKVLTISRELAAGLLADMLNPDELDELAKLLLPFVDLVYCNLYDLRGAILKAEKAPNRLAAIARVTAGTDIGGPGLLLRAGAKGFRIVINRRCDMEMVLKELSETGDVCWATRQELRWRAEAEVGKYVCLSAEFQSGGRFHSIHGELVAKPLYGENPYQTGAKQYSFCGDYPLAIDKFVAVGGMQASHNNNSDMGRCVQTLTHMVGAFQLNFNGETPFAGLVVKHGNVCGGAMGFATALETVIAVARGNRLSAFGGCAMFNFPLTAELAEAFVREAAGDGQTKQLFDCVAAPGFDDGAIDAFRRKTDKCRLKVNPALATHSGVLDVTERFMYLPGGFQTQPNYTYVLDLNDPEIKIYGPTDRLDRQRKIDILLGWAFAATSNSNKIVIVRNGMLLGNGAGRQDRVGAGKLAINIAIDAGHGTKVDPYAAATAAVKAFMESKRQSGHEYDFAEIAKLAFDAGQETLRSNRLPGATGVGDSFFPQLDGVEVLIGAGVDVIYATSGSKNDGLIQQYCVDRGVTLIQLPDKKARVFFGHSG